MVGKGSGVNALAGVLVGMCDDGSVCCDVGLVVGGCELNYKKEGKKKGGGREKEKEKEKKRGKEEGGKERESTKRVLIREYQ
jgi:hypothetical protein